MKKTFIKIVIREIKESLGRFVAIFAIVALGVGFLAGLLSTTPNMKESMDQYYDQSSMTDIFIKSTMGLTDEDLKAISMLDEIEQVMPAYVTDALMEVNNEKVLPTRIYGLSNEAFKSEKRYGINQLKLIKGRMPILKTECVIERSGGYLSEINIGSTLRISQDNEDYDNINDIYNTTEYIVVGIVSNPFYYAFEREVTNIGNGRLGAIAYINESNYALDVYTDFYIKVSGAAELTAFSDKYENKVENVVATLENLGIIRSEIRYNDILTEATDKLNEAKKEYEEGKIEAELKLSDAWQEIVDGKQELIDAKAEIGDGKRELADAKSTFKRETAGAQGKIDDAKVELEDAFLDLEDGENELTQAIADLEEGKRQYDIGYLKYLEGLEEISKAKKLYNEGIKDYELGIKQIADAKKQIEDGEKKLSSAYNSLIAAEGQYSSGLNEYNEQKANFGTLMNQILGALNSIGMSYSSSEELFFAMENDTTGTISGAVTGVLAEIRANIQSQIDAISGLKTSIDDLEFLALAMEYEGLPHPDGKTLGEVKALLVELKAQYEIAKENIESLNAGLTSIPSNSTALKSSYYALKSAKANLDSASNQINSGWNSYYNGRDELNTAKRKYNEAIIDLEKARLELEDAKQELEKGQLELKDAKVELTDARLELEDGYIKVNNARAELDDGWEKYYDGLKEIAEAEETLKTQTADAQRKIQDAEKNLAQGQRDYEDGLKELAEGEADYYKAKAEVEQELTDAEKEIADAEIEISKIEMPKWYVLDRNANVSYVSFSMNADKVAAIATVFPVFFYLVAALVTLTTMTRMVEKERTQIGTFKALGYTKGVIMSKYLVYCGLASILGSITGLLVGFKLLPSIIWDAYGMMYHLPQLVSDIRWEYAISSSVIAVLCTMAATVNACYHSLKEKPAMLMLPKAPKAGKRIFLERITFIWSRLKFTYKATARNIFRYKKHFFMTIIGIAGCTALMLAGFGISDSLKDIANTQFEDIMKYQLKIELDEEKDLDSILEEFLADTNNVESYMKIYSSDGKAKVDKENFLLTIIIPEEDAELNKFIDLRARKSQKPITVKDDSIIMTEKLASTLNISKGDVFSLENSEGKTARVILTDICENYAGSYVYTSKSAYARYFNSNPKANTIWAKSNLSEGMAQDEAIEEILASKTVLNAEYASQIKKSYENLLSSIDFIVIVLIIAAGALAIIVLYNLINININERNKELATLKVLGYHNKEVAGYVFRETFILSIVGTLTGLVLGMLLHRFIVQVAENPDLMFGRQISSLSYVMSAVITILFSLAVDLIMYTKLKKIEMVDSMKAVD